MPTESRMERVMSATSPDFLSKTTHLATNQPAMLDRLLDTEMWTIAAVGGRAVVLCTHIGMATREHHLAEFNNEGVS